MSQVESSGGAEAVDTSTVPAAGDNESTGAHDSEIGASYLTRDDGSEGGPGDADGQEKAPAESEKEADSLAAVPEKPEDYQISFAEGVSVDEKLLSGFKAKAHELGIPQGQAQKLAEFYAQNVTDSTKAAHEAQVNAIREAEKEWIAEIEGRPGFKGELADVKRTLKEFGSDELTELMNQSRLGSHPVFFDFVVKVGKALAEPEARGYGSGSGKEKPLVDRLWPNMK